MRKAEVRRKTRETEIHLKLNIDGEGKCEVHGSPGFFIHMLETFTCHGCFDILGELQGDTHVDFHHLVEDTGLALGQVFREALAGKKGIKRAGFFYFPMDETLVRAAVDLSARPYVHFKADLGTADVGQFPPGLTEDFCRAFSSSLGATLHLEVLYGSSDHHKIEAIFKALARALKEACSWEAGYQGKLPTTKGMLG